MAYSNSRGNSSGDRPARRSAGPKNYSGRPDRSSSGEGKKIFNRNDKSRSTDSRDRKPYGDSPKGGYGDKPRTDRPYNADRNSDRPYNRERASGGDRPYNKDRAASDRPYSKDRSSSDRPYNKDRSFSDRPYNKDRGAAGRPSRSEGGD
ncbi:MAG TPA: hypothetical protein VK927_04565, partial [Adhaeribacter sp.]|nr:hypothetical protein [Adhaeribacter sp.]